MILLQPPKDNAQISLSSGIQIAGIVKLTVYKNIFSMKQPIKPQTAIIVSIRLHESKVSLIDKLKYSLKSQKPPSFT